MSSYFTPFDPEARFRTPKADPETARRLSAKIGYVTIVDDGETVAEFVNGEPRPVGAISAVVSKHTAALADQIGQHNEIGRRSSLYWLHGPDAGVEARLVAIELPLHPSLLNEIEINVGDVEIPETACITVFWN